MDIPIFQNGEDLMEYAKNQGMYGALVAQIKKDFSRVNLELLLAVDSQPKVLKAVLWENVYLLLMERFPEYLNVMYAVDIPEHAFKNLVITDTVDVAEQVTFLILNRELQKVSSKEKYRSKE